jgi:FixJ family two-component response regulator
VNIFNLAKEDLNDFKTEALQMLGDAEKALLAQGQSSDFKNLYNLLFRTVHGLKSAAQVLELKTLAEHLRRTEIELSKCKDHSSFSLAEIGSFRKGIEGAKNIISEEVAEGFDYNLVESKEFDMMASPVSTANLSVSEMGLAYIIDDEPDILEILGDTLKAAGLTTVTFTDPKAMLEAFQRQTPDLVISDMKMPGLSGIEILKEIKKINADVPVVFISGYLDTPNLLEAIQKGVYAAIEKPFDMNQVLEVSTNAVRLSQLNKLLSRSLNLILFQFTDLKDFLLTQGKTELARSIEEELRFLLEQRRKFRETKRSLR